MIEITREIATKVRDVVAAGLVNGVGVAEPGKMCVEAKIIELMEHVKISMETLRANAGEKGNGWNARALSIALTDLETSRLWLANARPE